MSSYNVVGSSSVSRLNVFAQPYIPLFLQHGSRIQRSLFMTFSSGLPLTPKEIYDHFTQEYGDCIEFVYVHKEDGRVPEFGRILFTSACLATSILGDQSIVKMFIGDKPIWLKKYVPKNGNSLSVN